MQRYTTLRAVRTLVLLCVLVLIEPFAASGCSTERAINVANEVTSVFHKLAILFFVPYIYFARVISLYIKIVGIV